MGITAVRNAIGVMQVNPKAARRCFAHLMKHFFLRNGGSRIGVGRRGSLGRKKLCIKSIGWNRTFPQDFKVRYQSKVPTEAQGTRLLSEADTRTKAKKTTFNLYVLSSSVSPHLKIVLRSTEEAQLGVRKEIL